MVLNIQVYDKQSNEIGDYDIEFKAKYDSQTDIYEVHNTMLNETKKIGRENNSDGTQTNGQTRIGSQIQADGLVLPGTPTTIVHTWVNPVVNSNNEFGDDEYSQCGND